MFYSIKGMTTALFVHGTGTRDPAFSQTLGDVRAALDGVADVQPCYWGERHGAWLHADGASIPEYPSTRDVTDVLADVPPDSDEEFQITLWRLLLDDPLAELRLLAESAGPAREIGLGETTASLDLTRLADWSTLLAADDPLRAKIADSRLAPLLAEVCGAVQNSGAFRDAENAADELTRRVVAARAVVAGALCLADEREIPTPARIDADLRDALVDGFTVLLVEKSRDVFDGVRDFMRDHIKRPLVGLAARGVTNRVRRKRGALTDSVTGPAGDILLYQGRGNAIRGFIRQRIESFADPVVLIAHSLGGIACVDLLAGVPLPGVKLLITCGSQAPLFYEIGALQSLDFADIARSQRLPAHFPEWLNFYDRRDFLSYVAAPLFANGHVTDVRVDNRLPFPESHSGYWRNAEVWKRVRAALPK